MEKKLLCPDLYIHPYFVSSCLHYRLTLKKKLSLETVIAPNNWFSSKHLKEYTKWQLHLGKHIKYTEIYKT